MTTTVLSRSTISTLNTLFARAVNAIVLGASDAAIMGRLDNLVHVIRDAEGCGVDVTAPVSAIDALCAASSAYAFDADLAMSRRARY